MKNLVIQASIAVLTVLVFLVVGNSLPRPSRYDHNHSGIRTNYYLGTNWEIISVIFPVNDTNPIMVSTNSAVNDRVVCTNILLDLIAPHPESRWALLFTNGVRGPVSVVEMTWDGSRIIGEYLVGSNNVLDVRQ